ncbi:MAG: molecular chaperone TorD family protein [Coriobacteriales bacterium]|nr:molecular chaperone TorD family protein [Coriobacteriales bacterium]
MAASVLGTMFRLFSLAFQPPTAELAGLVASGDLQSDMAAMWNALELDEAPITAFCDGLACYKGRDSEEVLHELRRDNTRMFLTDTPLIENSEGPWRKKAQGIEVVALMVNSYSTEVSDFMRYCGVVKAQGYNDCVDFIENECDFAGFLADGPEYLAEHNMDATELLDRFMDEHMKKWVPGFCEDVKRESQTPYYRTLCTLMQAFMQEF